MGIGVSAATAILLVGAIYHGGLLLSAHGNADDKVRAATADAEARALVKRVGAIDITTVSHNGGIDRLTVTVENTGGATFNVTKLELLIDGVVETSSITTMTVEGTVSNVWAPATTLIVTVDDWPPAPSAVIVVAPSGAADAWRT